MQPHPPLRTVVALVCVQLVVLARGTSPVRASDREPATNRALIERVSGKRLQIDRDDESVSVRQGNRLLLEYKYDGVSHKPYVSQLTSPSGDNVLRDAPSDHLHHHGLMFAWRVNDVNFWEETAESGRENHTQWRELRIATVEAGEDSDVEFTEQAILREALRREGPTGEVLLEEERVITVPFAPEDEPCVITWQSTFALAQNSADIPVRDLQLSDDSRTLILRTDDHITPRIYQVHLRGVRSVDGRALARIIHEGVGCVEQAVC